MTVYYGVRQKIVRNMFAVGCPGVAALLIGDSQVKVQLVSMNQTVTQGSSSR